VQAKLLRVLQEREFEPLGSERTQAVDVRVLAATNRDLVTMMTEGRFLEDLYYRLSVIPIDIPPLRDRRDDIPVLVQHFVQKHQQRVGKTMERVDDEALEMLENYDWPGNVRELENTIERATVLSTSAVIGTSELAPRSNLRDARADVGLPSRRLHENLEWAEIESIRRALAQAGGVKKKAAEILGISQRALSHHLRKRRIT
jgi:two-component system NtrC family response regulator